MAYAWVHQGARILENTDQQNARQLKERYRQLLEQIAPYQNQQTDPFLDSSARHFAKVTHSYWRGLFCCYDTQGLPRTNNATEQGFGSLRYQERRRTGRKVPLASTVLRGSVRILAATAQPTRALSGSDLPPRSLEDWHQLRSGLAQKQSVRAQQRRFRKDPEAYLRSIEQQLLKATLLP